MELRLIRGGLLAGVALVAMTGMGCAGESRQTELFFGLSTPAAAPPDAEPGRVTDREFQEFIESEVTPRFPAGYTVVSADGHWGENGKTLKEPSKILILYRPAGSETSAKIDAIRAAYKARFHQESVLRVDQRAVGSF